MSNTIDQKVVEMRFDNKQFESGAAESLSTLDKIKKALKLDGASKGLDEVSKAADKIDMRGLGNAVEGVRVKFSALQIMGVTALANITNSALNAGKRIASALTIDPIRTGLSEYETKINAIQVITANTRGKNTLTDINKALEDLNVYADKTIYNFAQMTSNIGKFTAQGLDVYEAADAVKGLANLAAASGASAEDMARATYQMSQALSGTIKLIDWNSLRNANMATMELKNTLMDLARVRGINIDKMVEEEGAFEQTLSKGWLTGEMFSEAMNIYSGVYSEAQLKAKGFSDDQVKNFMDLAKQAESAATEVKTITQLYDVLKETAQSGWTQTWEIIVGDFGTAKEMFTKLQVYLGDIINGFSDARNFLLKGALTFSKPWTAIMEKLESSGLTKGVDKIKKVSDAVEDVTDKVKKFQDIVNKVWRGDFGNSDTGRFEKLKEAGYDSRVVQDLVNKGVDYKLTIEDIEASHKKFGLTMDKTAESVDKTSSALTGLSDKQLENAGLTKDEIKLYRDLEEEAKNTGKTIEEIVDDMSKNDGRTLLIDSFKNAWEGVVIILGAVRDAWVDIFPPMSVVRLYGIIKTINEFTKHLKVSEETADKITRTFRGLFAAIDIVTTIFSGGLKIAVKIIDGILNAFGTDILSVTAYIGDFLVNVRNGIDRVLEFTGVFEKIGEAVKKAYDAIRKFTSNIDLPSFKDFVEVGSNIVDGLAKGVRDGISRACNAIKDLGLRIIEKIKSVLGIKSPSKVFMTIGGFLISGLALGILNWAPDLWEVITNFASDLVDKVKSGIKKAFGKFNWGAISALFWGASALIPSAPILNTIAAFTGIFAAFGSDLVSGLAKGITNGVKTVVSAIVNLAKSIIEKFCDILGIESPSKVFMALGGFLISGLILGIKNFFPELWDTISNMFSGITSKIGGVLKEFFGHFNMSAISGFFRTLAAMMPIPIFNVLAGLTAMFSSAGMDTLGGFIDGIEGGMKNVIATIKNFASTVIKKFCEILGIESPSKVFIAIGGFIIAGLIYGLRQGWGDLADIVSDTFGIIWDIVKTAGLKIIELIKQIDLNKLLVGLLAGGAIIALFKFAKSILSIGDALGSIKGVLGGIKDAIGEYQKNLKAKRIKEIAIAIAILAGSMIALAFIPWQKLLKAGIAIAAMAGILAGLTVAMKTWKPSDGMKLIQFGGAMAIMSVALLTIAGAISKMSGIELQGWDMVKKVGLLIGSMAAIAVMLTMFGKSPVVDAELTKASVSFIKIAAAVGILAFVCKVISESKWIEGFEWKQDNPVIKSLELIGLIAAGMALTARIAGPGISKFGGTILKLAIALGLMALVVNKIKDMKFTEAQIENLSVWLGGLIFMLTGLAIISRLGSGLTKFGTTVLAMAASIGILTLTLKLLTGIKDDTSNAMKIMWQFAAMIGVMILISKVPGDISSFNKTILSLSIGIGLLAGIAVLLGMVNPEYLKVGITAVGALSVMVGFMVGMTKLAKGVKPGPIIAAIIGIAAFVGAIVGLFFLFKDQSLQNIIAPIAAMVAVTAMLAILMKSLSTIGRKKIQIKPILAIAGAMVIMAGALYVLSLNPWESIAAAAVALGGVVTLISLVVMPALTKTEKQSAKALKGAGVLAAIAGSLVLMAGALYLLSLNPWESIGMAALALGGIMTLMSLVVLPALSKMTGYGNAAIGALVLLELAVPLAAFAFIIASMSNVQNALANSQVLALFMAEMVAICAILGLASPFITAGALAALALTAMAVPLAAFAFIIASMSNVQNALANSQILSLFMLEMGVLCGIMGAALPFILAGAIGALALSAMAVPLNLFVDVLAKMSGVQNALENSQVLSLFLLEMGGICALFGVGGPFIALGGLATEPLVKFAEGLNKIVTSLGNFDESKMMSVENACSVLKSLANVARSLPNEGGLWAKLVGDNSIGDFGDKLPALGENIKSFVSKLGTFGEDKIVAVDVACRILERLSKLTKSDFSGLGDDLKDMGGNLKKFADKLKDFCDDMSDVASSNIESAIDKVKKVITLAKDISSVNIGSLKNFGTSLKTIAKDGIKGFISELYSVDVIAKIKEAADKIVKAYTKAVKDKKPDVKEAFKVVSKEGAKGAKSNEVYSDFKAAGKYMAEGFANGISVNDYKAAAAARAMAKAAKQAAEKALGIQSPSKEMIKDGAWTVKGYVKGIYDNISYVKMAGTLMGNKSIEGLEESLEINSPAKKPEEDGKWTVKGFFKGVADETKNIFGNMFVTGEKLANQFSLGFNSELAKNSLTTAVAFEEFGSSLYGLSNWRDKAVDMVSVDNKDNKSLFEKLSEWWSGATGKTNGKDDSSNPVDDIIEKYNELGETSEDTTLKLIDDEKNLFKRLAAYKRLLASGTYAADSAEYAEITNAVNSTLDEIRSGTKTYYKDLEDLDNDHKQKVKDNITELTTAYDEAIKDRADSIKGTYGLFESVGEKEKVDYKELGKSLMDNLMGQWETTAEWEANMNKLTSKGLLNSDLIAELRQMGPEAAKEIEALTKMSDGQLTRYNNLYEMKARQATNIAKAELQYRRAMTDEELAAFSTDINELSKLVDEEGNRLIDDATITKLQEVAAFGMDDTILATKLHETLDTLKTEYDESYADLCKTWSESMGIAVEDTTDQYVKMIEDLITKTGDENQWSEPGANIVEGLVKGIIDKSSALYSTMSKVMTEAISVTMATIDAHSPSRVFAKIGQFMDMGLVVGLKNYAGKVVSTTTDVGKQAISAMSDAISRTCDLINSDVDMQPTIRPVLDLSNIRSGSRTIGELMNLGSSVGVDANVGAISAMMSNRRQNGTNNDVVSAINDLRGELGRTGNSYNINGIQYNEGSEVAEAIETLVRAARIERRT